MYDSEVHLIFDRYNLPLSLKSATHDRKARRSAAIVLPHHRHTNISKVLMKTLLSHVKTKTELTKYLAEKILVKAYEQSRTWLLHGGALGKQLTRKSATLRATKKKLTQSYCCTLLMQQTLVPLICFCSPDTGAFVLPLRRYPELCEDTSFITGAGQTHSHPSKTYCCNSWP